MKTDNGGGVYMGYWTVTQKACRSCNDILVLDLYKKKKKKKKKFWTFKIFFFF